MKLDDDSLRAALATIPTGWEERDGQRSAAVLAAVFDRGDEDWLLFTERHKDLPQHPGQIAFPGGAREGCEDPLRCALRECEEEIGLPPDKVLVLGALGNRRTSTSAFRVHTIVGRIANAEDLVPDPREVESIFAVRLAELLDEERWEYREYQTTARRYGPSPHFTHDGHLIWGLTGRLTKDLLDAIRASA